MPAKCGGERGGMRIAHGCAGFGDRPLLIAHQCQGVAHAAAEAVVEDGLAEYGLEALGERRLRHTHRAGQLANGRWWGEFAHESVPRHVQTLELALGVLLVRSA